MIMQNNSDFFNRPLVLTPGFTLPSRAILSPMEGIMNRENFFNAARTLRLIDSWMPPFIGIPAGAVPRDVTLKKRFSFFLDSGIPFTVQLLGHDPDSLAETAGALYRIGVRSVNLNCACPSKTVLASTSGGMLLKQPEIIIETLQKIRRNVPDICVSLKLRSGFRDPDELKELLAAVREGGIHWVIHHYRTVSEEYRDLPRQEAVRRLQIVGEELKTIPFFANGDIVSPGDAELYRAETLCSGIAVGRGILNDPFLLRRLRTGETVDPGLKQEFLHLLTSGIPGKRGEHFYLECVKMAYGADSPEFCAALTEQKNRRVGKSRE